VKKSRIYRDPNITAENGIPLSEADALEIHPAVEAAIGAGCSVILSQRHMASTIAERTKSGFEEPRRLSAQHAVPLSIIGRAVLSHKPAEPAPLTEAP
jgi:hypothetical protein